MTFPAIPYRGAWFNMPCWNGLSPYQQALLIELGGLRFGYKPMGTCKNGAQVEVTTMWDKAPGPRFYCVQCAIDYLDTKLTEDPQP